MSSSRRQFLAASGAAVLLGALGRPSLARAVLRAHTSPAGTPLQPPATSLLQVPVFTPLRRNVGCFTMRGGTVGYLVNDGGVLVIDSQYPAEARSLLEGLKERSGGRRIDYLVNTHHHGDHTGGNAVFRGVVDRVVAHEKAAEHMRQPPGGQPPADALYPDTTFTTEWSAELGDERIVARHYGRAHTSGDAVITFERANVVHMGDLMFNQRHPVVDRAAGATIRNWITVLERTLADHPEDAIYIFGHAGTGRPLTGSRAELLLFRDYLAALLAFVEKQVRAGRTREQIMAQRGPLAGFESFGPFGRDNPRDALTCAYEEVITT